MPLVFTVAAAVLSLLQTPPVFASVNVAVELKHNDAVPLIVPALGNGLTATLVVATAVPQLLVTV